MAEEMEKEDSFVGYITKYNDKAGRLRNSMPATTLTLEDEGDETKKHEFNLYDNQDMIREWDSSWERKLGRGTYGSERYRELQEIAHLYTNPLRTRKVCVKHVNGTVFDITAIDQEPGSSNNDS